MWKSLFFLMGGAEIVLLICISVSGGRATMPANEKPGNLNMLLSHFRRKKNFMTMLIIWPLFFMPCLFMVNGLLSLVLALAVLPGTFFLMRAILSSERMEAADYKQYPERMIVGKHVDKRSFLENLDREIRHDAPIACSDNEYYLYPSALVTAPRGLGALPSVIYIREIASMLLTVRTYRSGRSRRPYTLHELQLFDSSDNPIGLAACSKNHSANDLANALSTRFGVREK